MSSPVRAFVIQAHPLRDGYNAALFQAAVRGLEIGGRAVTSARLASGDDPTVADLAGHEDLVFVYPTWWGGLPAVLLDWVQRRLGAHIGHDSGPPPLAGVQRLTVVTTHGSSRILNTIQGEPGRHLLMRGVRRLCAPKVRARWVALYKLDRKPLGQLEAFVARVEREVAAR